VISSNSLLFISEIVLSRFGISYVLAHGDLTNKLHIGGNCETQM